MGNKIIIIDDDLDFLKIVKSHLLNSGFKNIRTEDNSITAVSLFESGEVFDIALFYNDTGYNQGNRGITSATLTEDSGSLSGPSTNGTDGYYIYNLNTSDYVFGWNTINFEASKQYYNNATTDFTFYLRVNTTIDPSIQKILEM